MGHEGPDPHILATPGGTQFTHARDLGTEPHAAGALDATGHLGGDQRTKMLVQDHPLALGIAGTVAPVAHGDVLQLTLPALIADGTVQGMVDEQELHGPLLGLDRPGRTGLDLHAGPDRGGTGRHRFGEGATALLRLHQTHAAISGDGELLVIAETRDRDALTVGDRDDHLARCRFTDATVDLDGELFCHWEELNANN